MDERALLQMLGKVPQARMARLVAESCFAGPLDAAQLGRLRDRGVSDSLLVVILGHRCGGAAPAAKAPWTGPSGEVISPTAGSRLRVALMEAMRPRVSGLMGTEVKFVVRTLRMRDTAAFFSGYPVRVNGQKFTDAEVARALREQVYDGADMMAWLVLKGGRWTVRELLINQSDVGYGDWCRDALMRSLMDGLCPAG